MMSYFGRGVQIVPGKKDTLEAALQHYLITVPNFVSTVVTLISSRLNLPTKLSLKWTASRHNEQLSPKFLNDNLSFLFPFSFVIVFLAAAMIISDMLEPYECTVLIQYSENIAKLEIIILPIISHFLII